MNICLASARLTPKNALHLDINWKDGVMVLWPGATACTQRERERNKNNNTTKRKTNIEAYSERKKCKAVYIQYRVGNDTDL